MSRVRTLFDEYDAYHQTRGNKVCHGFGIPLIVVSLLGLLSYIPLGGPFDLGMAFLLGTILYYFVLEWRLAILMTLAGVGMYVLGASLPLWLLAAMQVIGWTLQFVGHGVFEKKKPAFLKNIPHFLVGPMWFVNDLVHVIR